MYLCDFRSVLRKREREKESARVNFFDCWAQGEAEFKNCRRYTELEKITYYLLIITVLTTCLLHLLGNTSAEFFKKRISQL